MSTGHIFDIQRFALHDGPGIRTTVFLKGCPLHCSWCHNPESWSRKPQLMYQGEKCRNCLKCVELCPDSAHRQSGGRHILDLSKCSGCGICVENCIYGALKLSGYEADADTVMKEVAADISYYESSGGGLTVSGGEPMLQPAFLKELLQKAKSMGIHTCLETSGYARWEVFEQILGDVDLFLFDIKHLNDELHKKYTGVSNRLILENLDRLYRKGTEIRLRCPMIPGVNDTGEHIRGIAGLKRKYPNLSGVEILPYHDMGKGKWEQVGKNYEWKKLENTGQEQKEKLYQRFLEEGCEVSIG